MITVRTDRDFQEPVINGETWTVMDDGVLVIDDAEGKEIAAYANGAWKNVWRGITPEQRKRLLDEMVREAAEFGLYESTAEPKPTR